MTTRSMAGNVLDRAAALPDAVALVDGGREVSYAELAHGIEATASRLAAHGVRAGDTIALEPQAHLQDATAWAGRLYALNFLGAIALPIAVDEQPGRREHLLRKFGARRLDWRRVDGIAGAGPAVRADTPEGPTFYRFSTGSTGEPKAVILPNEKWFAMQTASGQAVRYAPSDRLLPAIPMPSAMGIRNLLRIHMAGGALVNEQLPQNLPALAEVIRRHRVTQVSASPAQLRWLLSQPAPAGFRMPPLNGVVTAGAPLLPAEQARIRELITPNLYIDYGAMDFSIIGVQRPGEAPEAGFAIVPGVEAEVVDDADRPVPPGVTAQLRVRAAWSPTGHAGQDASPQFRGGWFYPGDLAAITPERRLRLAGRADELINRGGVKVAPRAIEDVLAAHPEVTDAAVVGVADAIAGEAPVAFVVLRRQEALQELPAWHQARLASVIVPARFLSVNAIPRSPEGKILRAQLRALAS
jgi:long-chain acyl-CoA synthetase